MGEEDKFLSKFKDLLASQHRAMECPICLEVAKVPVKQCCNGHVTCSLCTNQLIKCSLCQQPFLQQNSTCVNNLLEVLPRLCRYSDRGCKELFVTGDKHELFCGFRPVVCWDCFYNDEFTVREMVKHFCEQHEVTVCIEHEKEFGWTFDERYFNTQHKYSRNLVFDDSFFCMKSKRDPKSFTISIYFEEFCVGEPKSDYYFKFKVETHGYVIKKTIKAILMKGTMSDGLEDMSKTGENIEDFYMVIPQSLCNTVPKARNYSDEDDEDYSLSYTFSVFKKKITQNST